MQPRKNDPVKHCWFCAARLHRKVFASGRLEDMGVFKKRKYCDQLCMAQGMVKQEVAKATHHHRARKNRKDKCERCGSTEKLHVHHRDDNWKNDDPSNHETVCQKCHGKEHGARRGELFATRTRIEKQALIDIWIALKRSLSVAKKIGDMPLVREIEDVLHRNGQL